MATTSLAMNKATGGNLVIVFVLISVVVLGGSVLAAKSLVTTIVRDTKVVTAKTKANKQLDENLSAAPQLVSAYEGLGDESKLLADALPTTIDLPGLIVMIENMGGDTGLSIKTVSSLQTATGTGGATASAPATSQVYPFGVTFDGSYAALQRFLADVEQSARPMRVVGLQLNGSGSALSGTIDIETYYQARAALPFSTETIK